MADFHGWTKVTTSSVEVMVMMHEDRQALANVGIVVAFGVAVMLALIVLATAIG